MKRQIYGRKEGSGTTFELLIESPGAKSGSPNIDPEKMREFEIANTRRAVQTLREKSIEGYVLFEGDATRYVFTSKTDFQYPTIA